MISRWKKYFPWYERFGTIPSDYREAMSYEEQIIWLCKEIEEFEEEIKVLSLDYENLLNLPTINGTTIIGNILTNDLGIDYEHLINIPSINGVPLLGNKTTEELTILYDDIKNKPTINGVFVMGDKTLQDYKLKSTLGIKIEEPSTLWNSGMVEDLKTSLVLGKQYDFTSISVGDTVNPESIQSYDVTIGSPAITSLILNTDEKIYFGCSCEYVVINLSNFEVLAKVDNSSEVTVEDVYQKGEFTSYVATSNVAIFINFYHYSLVSFFGKDNGTFYITNYNKNMKEFLELKLGTLEDVSLTSDNKAYDLINYVMGDTFNPDDIITVQNAKYGTFYLDKFNQNIIENYFRVKGEGDYIIVDILSNKVIEKGNFNYNVPTEINYNNGGQLYINFYNTNTNLPECKVLAYNGFGTTGQINHVNLTGNKNFTDLFLSGTYGIGISEISDHSLIYDSNDYALENITLNNGIYDFSQISEGDLVDVENVPVESFSIGTPQRDEFDIYNKLTYSITGKCDLIIADLNSGLVIKKITNIDNTILNPLIISFDTLNYNFPCRCFISSTSDNPSLIIRKYENASQLELFKSQNIDFVNSNLKFKKSLTLTNNYYYDFTNVNIGDTFTPTPTALTDSAYVNIDFLDFPYSQELYLTGSGSYIVCDLNNKVIDKKSFSTFSEITRKIYGNMKVYVSIPDNSFPATVEKTSFERATGGTGTTNYNDLLNKPSINGVALSGNKTAFDLKLEGFTNYVEALADSTNGYFYCNIENPMQNKIYHIKIPTNSLQDFTHLSINNKTNYYDVLWNDSLNLNVESRYMSNQIIDFIFDGTYFRPLNADTGWVTPTYSAYSTSSSIKVRRKGNNVTWNGEIRDTTNLTPPTDSIVCYTDYIFAPNENLRILIPRTIFSIC